MERLGFFGSKLCYVVCRGTKILDMLEVPVKIRTDWQAYLSDPTASQRRQSKKEINFLKKWQGQPDCDIHGGFADNMAAFIRLSLRA